MSRRHYLHSLNGSFIPTIDFQIRNVGTPDGNPSSGQLALLLLLPSSPLSIPEKIIKQIKLKLKKKIKRIKLKHKNLLSNYWQIIRFYYKFPFVQNFKRNREKLKFEFKFFYLLIPFFQSYSIEYEVEIRRLKFLFTIFKKIFGLPKLKKKQLIRNEWFMFFIFLKFVEKTETSGNEKNKHFSSNFLQIQEQK